MTRNDFMKMLTFFLGSFSAFGQSSNGTLRAGWAAWKSGDVTLAHAAALRQLDTEPDEAHHLLFLTEYVSGHFERALEHYAAIASERVRKRHAETAVEAQLFLRQLPEALAIARSETSLRWMTPLLERQRAQPFQTSLDRLSVVPFAEHPLTEYFPAFSVEIDGTPETAHVDTGGAFLYMGPERAKALGIDTVMAGHGRYHLDLKKRPVYAGFAERFVLGDAVLENVPVAVLPTLTGESDFIIFGTCILHEFLPTLDYPRSRLILSPRGDATRAAEHRAMLNGDPVRVPFYVWGDHFMFARGNFGERNDLNFFVDSGLVMVRPDSKGVTRQCAFTTSKRKLAAWGVSRDAVQKGYLESPQPLGLGALQQDGHLIEIGAAGDTDFGGVRIDGLLSHAFLKAYTWTIDFDAREYEFRR